MPKHAIQRTEQPLTQPPRDMEHPQTSLSRTARLQLEPMCKRVNYKLDDKGQNHLGFLLRHDEPLDAQNNRMSNGTFVVNKVKH